MAELQLTFLGGVGVRQDGSEVTNFGVRKARALLCYLALNQQPIPRASLAGLLWGDMPEASARMNLRRTLSRLRPFIGPHLVTSRREIMFNRDVPYWLDVERFESAVSFSNDNTAQLRTAIDLYQGDFLDGFFVRRAPAFEEWMLTQRVRLRDLAVQTLHTLVADCIEQNTLVDGITYAHRLLALDPWREEAHRQLMELLARSGQRSAALMQYDACRLILAEELGVDLAPETKILFEAIRSGEIGKSQQESINKLPIQMTSKVSLPPFLIEETLDEESVVFVARGKALQQLDEQLQIARERQGQVVFIAGEAGSGKTALLAEFSRRAQMALPDLLIAQGVCSAYSGVGDPFQPFRDILSMLTGNVESRWRAGTIIVRQARSLWGFLPRAVPILLKHGSGLIDSLIPGPSLLSRSQSAVPNAAWLGDLRQIVEVGKGQPSDGQQRQLFEMVVNVLKAMAAERPLLLMLDDLQWADAASLNLLFHLGRCLGNGRLLILGAYRSDEIALGRDGDRHPLEPLRNEFRRIFGENELNLDETTVAEGQAFVDAYLDTEPNNLDEKFRQALVQHTGGQALFVIEMLRDLQARGDLIQDEHGRWTSTATFSWDVLPARVEGIIAERLSRLEPELQQILSVASVEGQEFTLQIIAHVQQMEERPLLHTLSQELEKRHGLIQASGEQRVGQQYLTHYRFSHVLFQHYLYDQLSQTERRLLHGEIGERLENLYQAKTETILTQLAYHFSEADEAEKAADYLLLAGDRARELYVHDEAALLYERALPFLKKIKAHERTARTQMKLGLTHHLAFNYRQARRAYDEGFRLWQQAERKHISASLPPAPHPLRMPEDEPSTLDPMFLNEDNEVSIGYLLFSSLVSIGPKMNVLPEVAQSWEVAEGGCTYTFLLQDDVRWSDSVPVTARDFAFALKRQLQPNIGATYVDQLFDIRGAQAFHEGNLPSVDQVGIQAVDDTTLLVELERPASDFLYKMAGLLPVPRHVVKAWGPAWTDLDHFVSNGPFLLESWQPGKAMIFVRNPTYCGQFLGNLERVELLFQLDWSTILARYNEDKIDTISRVSQKLLRLIRQRYASEYVSFPNMSTLFVMFDGERSPFADPRVRRAFVLALDREKLANVNLDGYLFPATGGFIPPGVPGYSPEIGLLHDPEQARAFLTAAGFPNGQGFPEVQALAAGRGFFVQVRENVYQQWQDVLGVSVNWRPVGYTQLDNEPSEILLGGWAGDYPDPANFLVTAVRSKHRSSKAYEAMLEKAAQSINHLERLKLYQAADKFLVDEAVIVPIAYGRRHYLVKPWIKNLIFGNYRWQDIIIEPH